MVNFVLTSQRTKPSIQYILVDREIEGISWKCFPFSNCCPSDAQLIIIRENDMQIIEFNGHLC